LRIGAVARSGGKFKGSEGPVQKKNAFPRLAVDDSFGLRLSLFFATSFLIVGCYMPYLPLWLKWRGLSEPQIALIYAVPVFTRALFIPAMTFLADRYERPAGFITTLSWGALATILVLPWAEGFAAIFAALSSQNQARYSLIGADPEGSVGFPPVPVADACMPGGATSRVR
jgi:MFS family permease